MDQSFRERLLSFVKPLYQDLDGVSRMTETDRVSAIARRLFEPEDPASRRHFELLLIFQGLGKWLDRVGNLSRVLLVIRDLPEEELQRVVAAVKRLESPTTDAERAIYAARLIDRAGLLGLSERFAQARREGMTIQDVAAEENPVPTENLSPLAAEWLARRHQARLEVRRQLLAEMKLEDL